MHDVYLSVQGDLYLLTITAKDNGKNRVLERKINSGRVKPGPECDTLTLLNWRERVKPSLNGRINEFIKF